MPVNADFWIAVALAFAGALLIAKGILIGKGITMGFLTAITTNQSDGEESD